MSDDVRTLREASQAISSLTKLVWGFGALGVAITGFLATQTYGLNHSVGEIAGRLGSIETEVKDTKAALTAFQTETRNSLSQIALAVGTQPQKSGSLEEFLKTYYGVKFDGVESMKAAVAKMPALSSQSQPVVIWTDADIAKEMKQLGADVFNPMPQ